MSKKLFISMELILHINIDKPILESTDSISYD